MGEAQSTVYGAQSRMQQASWKLSLCVHFWMTFWVPENPSSLSKEPMPTSMANTGIFSSLVALRIDHTTSVNMPGSKGCPQGKREWCG